MARTQAQLRDQIEKNLPGWMRNAGGITDAIFQGLAAGCARLEAYQDLVHDTLYIGKAEGSWLDQHGLERNVRRLTDEDDEIYRARIKAWPDAVTVPAIKAAVNRMLTVGTCTLEEHEPGGDWTLEPQAGTEIQLLGGEGIPANPTGLDLFGFTVRIEPQIPATSDVGWLVDDGEPGEHSALIADGDGNDRGMALAGDPVVGTIYQRIFDEIDRIRAAGTSFQLIVREGAGGP